jgi:hypothetical protein
MGKGSKVEIKKQTLTKRKFFEKCLFVSGGARAPVFPGFRLILADFFESARPVPAVDYAYYKLNW